MFMYFFISLSIPVVMIVIGLKWQKNPPKKKNTVFEIGSGYKTTWSIKSHEAWEFSHEYIGKIYVMVGISLVMVSILLWYAFGYEDFPVKFVFFLQIAGMAVPIIPTQNALRENFNANGDRIRNVNE